MLIMLMLRLLAIYFLLFFILDFSRIGLVMMTIIIFLQCTCFTFC